MLKIIFGWPDQFNTFSFDTPVLDAARLYRLQRFGESEAVLLSKSITSLEERFLFGLVLLRLEKYSSFIDFFPDIESLALHGSSEYLLLWSQYLLQNAFIPQLSGLIATISAKANNYWPLKLVLVAYNIHLNNLDIALSLLASLDPDASGCLEALRLTSRIYERTSRWSESLNILQSICIRFPDHKPSRIQLLDVAIKAKSQEHTLPILNSYLADFGVTKEVLTLASQIRLLQNRSGESLSLVFQNRIWNSIRSNSESHGSNIYNCYERLGCVDWLLFSPVLLESDHTELPLIARENLCMQLASLESPKYQPILQEVICSIENELINLGIKAYNPSRITATNSTSKRLRIAWLSADISYHPVGRFLLGILSSSISPRHSHYLVDTLYHGTESADHLFSEIKHLSYINLSSGSLAQKISTLRSMDFDIAIDLSGWTSGHFLRGFAAGIARKHVSYLGYFATTGLKNIDYWIGDDYLFPSSVQEWHTEKIWRLPRCFIAWNPPTSLPESQLEVPPIAFSDTSGVRFGCFNHHRKLSDLTLSTWGRILNSIPDSKLVLKSGNENDRATSDFLANRLAKSGIKLDQIIWVNRPTSCLDHLNQYSQIDIALDPFPNGGCTTTCEALWMGVPVITLSGNSYVSRMSTAVLCGASLHDWCASTVDEYVLIAQSKSHDLSSLRKSRYLWRHSIKTNPLGDSAGLFNQLELSFSEMISL